jgi:hypothetical protein
VTAGAGVPGKHGAELARLGERRLHPADGRGQRLPAAVPHRITSARTGWSSPVRPASSAAGPPRRRHAIRARVPSHGYGRRVARVWGKGRATASASRIQGTSRRPNTRPDVRPAGRSRTPGTSRRPNTRPDVRPAGRSRTPGTSRTPNTRPDVRPAGRSRTPGTSRTPNTRPDVRPTGRSRTPGTSRTPNTRPDVRPTGRSRTPGTSRTPNTRPGVRLAGRAGRPAGGGNTRTSGDGRGG